MTRNSLQLFFNTPRLWLMLLLGFASGLPLALTASTLQAWFTVSHVDMKTIGFVSLVGAPYTFKFLWAPITDRYVIPFLGRRRGWMLISQLLLIASLVSMAFLHPIDSPWLLVLIACVAAFFSATQDIIIDAYRTDILREEERGLGLALHVAGYRIAMLISGAIALILADHMGWRSTYLLMASLMLVGVLAALLGKEPILPKRLPHSLLTATIEPLKEFLQRKYAILFLVLIVLYKLGDAFAMSFTTPFLLSGLHFTLTEVGAAKKILEIVGTLMGAFIGGFFMVRVSLFRALLWFGILQAVSNLGYAWLALVGHHFVLMSVVVFTDNLCAGMGTVAFLALLSFLCDTRYTATQFALFTALSAVGRVFIGPVAGYMVSLFGWTEFFLVTSLACLPGLFLLCYVRGELREPLVGTALAEAEI